ncbi:hypothetical protein ACP4OV_010771 [Aristida adscensionis]
MSLVVLAATPFCFGAKNCRSTCLQRVLLHHLPGNPARRSQVHSVSPCGHAFYASCIVQHVAAKVGENIVHVPCPEHGCMDGGAVWLEDYTGMAPLELLDRWGLGLCEAALGATRLYCPYRDCSVPLGAADEEEGGAVEAECPHCHRLFYVWCAVSWHDNVSCEELRGCMFMQCRF